MSTRLSRYLLVTLLVGLALDGPVRAQETASGPVEVEIPTADVVIDGVSLFRVRGVSSFPAEVRARLIRERVEAAARDRAVSSEALQIVESDGARQILAGDRLLVTLVDADARLEQVDLAQLATLHLARIRQALLDYREARSAQALWRDAGRSVAATVLLAIIVLALLWTWRWADRLLTHRVHGRIKAVESQSLSFVRVERLWEAVRAVLLALRTFVVLTISLVYVGFVLAQFPWTQGLSRDIASFALGPLQVMAAGIVESVPGLVFLAVLYFVFRLGLRLARAFFDAAGRGAVTIAGFDPEWAQPTYKIVRVAVVAFGLIVAYPYIPGSQSDAFKGISIFIGVVFSLGSSSAISNLIAGYMMIYRRAFKVGDRVKIGDAIGDVIAMRLQVTHLRSFKNEEIVIPNSQILASEVINYSSLAREHGLILHTEVGIGYETPWRQVEAMLLMAAERTSGLLASPRPFVLQKRLGDFAIVYELNVYCANVPAMNALYTDLHRNILDVFNEYGVQIMTPAYEGDPPEPKVVAVKDWHAAPAASPR